MFELNWGDEMKKYPLMEIKDFLDTVFKRNIHGCANVAIGNMTQLQIIKFLLENEDKDIFQKDFENALHIKKSTVSGILDTMEKNRVIVRLSSKTDARGKIVRLSEDFANQKKAMIEEVKKTEEKIVDGIEDRDLETFFKVLDKMKENLRKEEDKND